jgi:uncharacterized Fe-S cluster-containing protein
MTQLIYPGSITEVLKKMDTAKRIVAMLPGIDCGACGSPSCRCLAEDIVRGEAAMTNCIFIRREHERTGKLDGRRAFDIVEEIWGNDFLKDKDTNN